MQRKEVNPESKKTSGGFLKRFAVGVLGGVVGSLIIVGAFYLLNGSGSNPTNSSGTTNNAGETVVSNVKVNVDSDITSAVDKVQDAVVSVINLQKQSQSSELSPWGGMFGQEEGMKNLLTPTLLEIWKKPVKAVE